MRTAFFSFFLVLLGCAQVREPSPIAEQQLLRFYQVTNGADVPSIEVRALRYADHVSLVAECFLRGGKSVPFAVTQSARTQCQSSLAGALAEFQAHNTWHFLGLLPEPPRWSAAVGSDGVLTFTGVVRLPVHAR